MDFLSPRPPEDRSELQHLRPYTSRVVHSILRPTCGLTQVIGTGGEAIGAPKGAQRPHFSGSRFPHKPETDMEIGVGQKESTTPAFLVWVQLIRQRDTGNDSEAVFYWPFHGAVESGTFAERAEVNLRSERPQAGVYGLVSQCVTAGDQAGVIDTITGSARGA